MVEKLDSWAVLFDLDETLVLTSKLESLRRTRDWPAVYAAFDRTTLPAGTASSLKRLTEAGHQIGIITKSPRSYATRLVEYHSLEIPVLVAYHDVQRQKPHPESLLKAAVKLSIPPNRSIYVGDHQDDVIAARAAGFEIVVVRWGNSVNAIDMKPVCEKWEDILSEVERITAGGEKNG
jgi:phosphoglycolate phosphatase-like HAD superfamily hydrolase